MDTEKPKMLDLVMESHRLATNLQGMPEDQRRGMMCMMMICSILKAHAHLGSVKRPLDIEAINKLFADDLEAGVRAGLPHDGTNVQEYVSMRTKMFVELMRECGVLDKEDIPTEIGLQILKRFGSREGLKEVNAFAEAAANGNPSNN